MKQLSKFYGCVACLFLIVFLVAMGSSPVMAGEKSCLDPKWADHPLCTDPDDPPTDPPPDPDPDDPCANFSAPDYAFWRESNKGRVPTKTIFLAESASGCEKELLHIDLSESGFVNRLNLAYSSVGTGDSFFGRIIFTREEWLDGSQGPSVWKYDFEISDGQLQPTGDPVMVLENTDPDNQHGRQLDLSADTGSLVWTLSEEIDDGLWELSIHTLDLSVCPDVDWPCATLDEGEILVEYDYHSNGPDPSTGTHLQNPVWGPFGERIYFIAHEVEPDSHSHYVQAIASDGSANGLATKIYGIEAQLPGDPSYRYVRSVASGLTGWPNAAEYLAVEIGEDNFFYSCADIYTLDVDACEYGGNCELQYEIGGSFQSWTTTGSILLSGLGGACKFNQIGIWDGVKVDILTKGYEPEAAGGH